MRSAFALGGLVALAGCAALPERSHLGGEWGGRHVGLVLEGGFGRLEYDCASGTIDEAILLGRDGRFEASGTHTPGQGGPVRVGEIFRSYRARYAGRVAGEVMELTVRVENGTVIGPLELRRGAEPAIVRCL